MERRRKSDEIVQLDVLTGRLDDARQCLKPGDPLYAEALYALEHQTSWNLREHALFWIPMLSAWPRGRGRKATSEHEALAGQFMIRHGLSLGEAANALFVSDGTLTKRMRQHGDVLGRGLPDDNLGRAVRRQSRRAVLSEGLPLPQVFDTSGVQPEWTTLNPQIPDPWRTSASPYAHQLLGAAQAALEERWRKDHGGSREP